MKPLNFDPQPYFRRLADAVPSRFQLDSYGNFIWYTNLGMSHGIFSDYKPNVAVFVCEMADEFDIWPRCFNADGEPFKSLLEAMLDGICKRFE